MLEIWQNVLTIAKPKFHFQPLANIAKLPNRFFMAIQRAPITSSCRSPSTGFAQYIFKMASWNHMGCTENMIIKDVMRHMCVPLQKSVYFGDGDGINSKSDQHCEGLHLVYIMTSLFWFLWELVGPQLDPCCSATRDSIGKKLGILTPDTHLFDSLIASFFHDFRKAHKKFDTIWIIIHC